MPADFFFPETVRIASLAFEDAVRSLPDAAASEEVKNLLARRILGTASLGVRDIVEMRDDGVAYVCS
jgi:hypothetical protein